MANDSKKTASSSFPVRQSSNEPLGGSKTSVDEIEAALEAALASGDESRVLEVIDAAPRWMKRQPEIMLVQATMLLSTGDIEQAFQLLREIERKNPRYTPVYLPLAMVYMEREWPAHALQAAKRAQSDPDLDDEGRDVLVQIIEEATALIQFRATKSALPFETLQRASILYERAQMAMDESKLSEADYFCREAIKIAPNWNPPYSLRAQALFFSGKVGEAISVLESVLARESENTAAMSELVTYHLGLNQPEQARDYASRLGQSVKKFPPDSIEIDHVITALALVGDTPALWRIAKDYLKAPSISLFGRSWLCLAVAAIRNGEWKVALKLLRKADKEELPPTGEELLAELKPVASQTHPRLAWMPPAYPGADLFICPKVMEEWEALLQKFSDPLSPSQKRKMDEFLQKYPFMVALMKLLIWDENNHQMALEILIEMDRTDADDEILRFALSQTGSQEARLLALTDLGRNGRYTGPKVLKLWNEELEEWRDIELNTQRIGPVKPNARPETLALIEKARTAKGPAETISLLQKAIEKEPTSPIAIFNLGIMLVQTGRQEEGEALFYRSVEVDPNYTYGHASIALSEADQGHEQEALDHLGIVTRADIIAPDTAVIANIAWAMLAIHKHETKSARQRFEMALQINPDHPLLEHYEKVLREAEDIAGKFDFLLEYQRKSAQRAHQKLMKTPLTGEMDLRACLETNTKEMLVGSAHFLRTSSSGKKGELASWLAEVLLNPGFLQQTLDEDLAEKEREALQWMLAADGVRPWKEFTHKYGDDADESTAWDYNQPESITGRLRMSGLFYSGVLDGQPVAFVPADVRSLLQKLLK